VDIHHSADVEHQSDHHKQHRKGDDGEDGDSAVLMLQKAPPAEWKTETLV
jgi:hypothetical protein